MRDFHHYWIEGEPAAEQDSEQRRAARIEVAGDVLLTAADRAEPHPAQFTANLRDLSWFGLGLVTDVPVESGTRWRARFVEGARELGRQFLAVRHCRALEDGRYLIGCQFCLSPAIAGMVSTDDFGAAAA